MIKISAIVVTFNNEDTIKKCLQALIGQTGEFNLEIIVIDNNSTDKTAELVKADQIKLIENQDNIGFGRAINQAAETTHGQYLFLINPDAELVNEKAVDNLLKASMSIDNIGMAGGKFINRQGRPMVSFGNFPTGKTRLVQKFKLHKIFPWGSYIEPTIFSQKLFIKKHLVDWVSGGFCLISKKLFDQLKGFDEKYFMYLEDVDLAKRAALAGWRTVFEPKALAYHDQTRSSSRQAKKLVADSLKHYKKKFNI